MKEVLSSIHMCIEIVLQLTALAYIICVLWFGNIGLWEALKDTFTTTVYLSH